MGGGGVEINQINKDFILDLNPVMHAEKNCLKMEESLIKKIQQTNCISF